MKIINLYVVLTTAFSLCHGNGSNYSSQINTIKAALSGSQITDFINYPSLVKDYSLSGVSVVEFDVDISGNISGIQIVKSLGKPFDLAIYEGIETFNNRKILQNKVSKDFRYRLPILFEN